MGKLINLTGQKFNMLTVIERKVRDVKGVFWLCKCDCGKESIVSSFKLKSGHTKSCGCLWLTTMKKTNTKHGMHKTPTYHTWQTMIQRTTNKNNDSFHRYGAIGIGVCQEWRTFENFLNDMGERPKGKTLDRIDNKLGYSPENCQWSDASTQMRNRKINGSSKYRGVSKTKNGKYLSAITIDKKIFRLGTFKTEIEAAEAYQEACLKYVGYTLPMTDSV
jgi:hypothetical protein